MRFIDTHTHIYDAEAYAEDMDQAINRAVAAGVTRMVLPDIASESRSGMFSLADKFPENLFPCLGLHPTDVDDNWEKEWAELEKELGRKIYGIGETGLDLYWSKEWFEQQKEVFRRHLRLGLELDLPVIVHNREATLQTIDIIREFKGKDIRGVMHAYTGSIETVREILNYGDWYFGIGGVVTFKKASIGETVKDIPLERIILETDSPYLTPVPHRGQRNESAYIPYIAKKIAEAKNISIEEVAKVTTENAERLFRI